MSTFKVPTVEIGAVGKHPNADSLSITTVEGCPCIFSTGDFVEGDIAIYVPVESVVPETVPGTEFLGRHRRIKARKIRGIFSMGLLLPYFPLKQFAMGPGYRIGRPTEFGFDMAPSLGIKKYVEPEDIAMQTDAAPAPTTIHWPPTYDMESYRKYKHLLTPGEKVYVTEKIHGTNSRFVYHRGALHVGSHNGWKRMDERNLWWKVAVKYDLEHRLKDHPGMIVYGETYGQVQDLKYGAETNELRLSIFDVFDSTLGMWLDYENIPGAPVYDLPEFCFKVGLIMVPLIYHGPYDPAVIEPMADGDSVASTTKQIREGIVIRPAQERWNNETGRTVMKLVGENYLTRKGGTERH
jgi:RNA ligase (TIGR02306 family)